MRNKMGFAGKLVGAGALTALLATAAVAAPAPQWGGQRQQHQQQQQQPQRQQQQYNNRGNRQSAQQLDTRGQGNYGRGQQGNVYRGQVDNRRQGNYGYRQPADVVRVVIRLGRQGNYGYGYQQQGALSGVVEQINYRIGTMVIQDQATGRFINIDMRRMGGVAGLRCGEFVTVYGQWEGGNTFAAYQIS